MFGYISRHWELSKISEFSCFGLVGRSTYLWCTKDLLWKIWIYWISWILVDVLLIHGDTIQTLPMDPNIQGSFLFNNNLNQFPSDLKGPVCQYSVPNSFYKLNPGLNSQLQPGTPHGINDILSRSMVGVGSTGTTTLLSGYSTMGGFGPSVTSTSMYYNRDYNPSLGSFSKIGAECPMKGRSVSCWAESTCEWRGRQQCTNSECQRGRLSQPPGKTLLGLTSDSTKFNTGAPKFMFFDLLWLKSYGMLKILS